MKLLMIEHANIIRVTKEIALDINPDIEIRPITEENINVFYRKTAAENLSRFLIKSIIIRIKQIHYSRNFKTVVVRRNLLVDKTILKEYNKNTLNFIAKPMYYV